MWAFDKFLKTNNFWQLKLGKAIKSVGLKEGIVLIWGLSF